MSDYRTLLERDLERVARPAGFTFDDVARRRDRKRQRQRISAGVVGIAVFVAAVWLVTSGGGSDRTQTPVVPGGEVTGPTATAQTPTERVGFIGLPPVGATPSMPETGDPVLRFYGGTTRDGRITAMWVYADGRVIWGQNYGASHDSFTGYLERRLTPEGVELARSEVTEVTSARLFDSESTLSISADVPCFNLIEVREGNRVVSITYRGSATISCPEEPATNEQQEVLLRLDGRLGDPASWLPARAWADAEIRAYVPSRFAVCYGPQVPVSEPIGAGRLLASLPSAAEDLLRTKDRTVQTWFYFNPPKISEPTPVGSNCSVVTTEEARVLDAAFAEAGFGPGWGGDEVEAELSYGFRAPDPIGRVVIEFKPVLPHGEWA